MFYNAEHNQYVNEGSAFTLGDVAYPANWLNLASAEDKAAIGLVEVTVIGAPADDRYYWVSEQLDGATLTYVNTPKDLDSLKANATAQINETAHLILSPSDYMTIKQIETGTPMADAWKVWRESIRATASSAKAAVAAAADIDALIVATQIKWPNDPNYVPPAEEPGAV